MDKSLEPLSIEDLENLAHLLEMASKELDRAVPVLGFGRKKALRVVSGAIDELIHLDSKDDDYLRNKSSCFGAYWGELICQEHKWQWGLLFLEQNDQPALVIHSKDFGYVIHPRELVFEMITDSEKGNTSELLFDTLGEMPSTAKSEMVELW